MDNNVINFPNSDNDNTPLGTDMDGNELHPGNDDSIENTSSEEINNEENNNLLIDDPDNPLNAANEYQIKNMLSNLGDTIRSVGSLWESTKTELKITQDHINELKAFNTNHVKPMPENLTDEEKEEWNPFNGLDELTDDDISRIFGEEHPLSGHFTPLSLAIDRCNEVMNTLNTYINLLAEYRNIHEAYMSLIENEEARNIEILKETMEKETDPDKKAAMQKSLDSYYNHKTLGFLAEPLSDKEIERFVNSYCNEKTIEYWIKRTRDKLKRLKLNDRAILEISQFEKRFLPEKYWKVNNMLLLYFLNLVTYCDPDNKKDDKRIKVIDMIIVLDKIIRNTCTEEYKNGILENIMKFDDQFIDKISTESEDNESSNNADELNKSESNE